MKNMFQFNERQINNKTSFDFGRKCHGATTMDDAGDGGKVKLVLLRQANHRQ